jgi:hypothetical protein
MAYCRHDMPEGTCALCAPRRPVTIHLIACGDYDEGPRTVGGKVCVHRPDCYSATPHEGAQRPYPRWETTEDEARAHHWHFCQLCKP